MHERLGFRSVRNLIESWVELRTSGTGLHLVIEAAAPLSHGASGDLRTEIADVVAALCDENLRRGRILQLPTVGGELARRFPDPVPLFRRLGFANLTELIRSYEDFEVIWQNPRWVVLRRGRPRG